MANHTPSLDRRTLIAGLGAVALGPLLPAGPALGSQSRLLAAKADTLALGPGAPGVPVWSIAGPPLDLTERQTVDVEFRSGLPVPVVLGWRGIDGLPAVEPMLARRPISADGIDKFQLTPPHAGTFICDLSPLGDSQARPARCLPLIVRESQPVSVDRDEALLIEEWRLRADGTAIPPGSNAKETTSFYTLNGKTSLDISARPNERLRLRLINGSQRTLIALKMEGIEVSVMALDGLPAEPFLARSSALALTPGGRADVFIDATAGAGSTSPILLHDGKQVRPIGNLVISREPPIRSAPLPPAPPLLSNGLPAQIDLQKALRFDIPLAGPTAEWARLADLAALPAPAFRAKRGRAVVLSLTNRAAITTVFHLHGHHFRLLDRLDDGWKPYWLDTLAIEPGQTQRIAFLAEHAGRFLVEQVATDWASPRLVRWYAVE